MKKLILLFTVLASASLAFGQGSVTYTNAGTTGTTLNSLAIINTSNNAVIASTSNTGVPTYVVVGGAGTTGLAVLGVVGQANCTFDSTIASAAGGFYVIASVTTGGDCHAQSAAPSFGTWVVGYLASASTSSGSTAAVTLGGYYFAGSGPASVANSDGTLTISPTTGAVVASLALGHANTWTAAQTFTNSDLKLLGSSTGVTTFTSANAGASNFTLTVPAATDTLAALAQTQTWTGAQSFTNADFKLLGSTSGAMTLEAPAIAGTF